jgi:(2Fe-2S) ferredoxin
MQLKSNIRERIIMISPKYHIFVCASCRINGIQKGFCHSKASVEIIQRFMQEIDDHDLSSEVMVTNTGCFGICDKGPVVVIYPEGTWYGNVSVDDVETIVEKHLVGGEKVEELLI